LKVEGFVEIKDKTTGEILISKPNQIHFENMSLAIARSLSHRTEDWIHEMHFGNGGATVSGTGVVTYLPPNTTGSSADLYNPTYYKVIDDNSSLNAAPLKNFMTVVHTSTTLYSDIVINATVDFGEPADQTAFDDTTDAEGLYVFDEIGLKSYDIVPENGLLLTHVIFHPIQKSLNRIIEITYTIRISMA
jgi:hypothetical protein